VWLAWKGALGAFVEQAFLFSIDYVSVRPGFADRVVRLWRSLNAFSFLSLAVLPLTFAVLAPNKTSLARWRLPLLFTYVLAFVALSISGRFYNHYYLAIVPPVSLLLAFGLSGFTTDSNQLWLSYLKGGLILVVVLLSIPNLPFVGMLRKDASTLMNWPPIAKYEQINKEFDSYLGPISGKRGQFYSWGEAGRLHLNVHFNITSPSKWVFTHLWAAENFDPDGSIFMSVLEDIETSQTKFILDYSVMKPLGRQDLQSKWDSYIRSNYRVEAVMRDGSTLWMRRNTE
jgi:hypothetical protein